MNENLLQEFLTYCRVRNLSKGTLKEYKRIVQGFIAWLDGRDPLAASPREIRGYVSDRFDAGVKPSTMRTELGSLGAFYSFLVADGLIDPSANPIPKVPLPKSRPPIIEPLTDEQIKGLLPGLNGHHDDRNRTMILVMLDTGLRAAEVAGLNIGDINFKERQLKVLGKGGKERFVYMGEKVSQILRDYVAKERSGNATDPLFPSREGRITPNGICKVVRRRMRGAGIPRANSGAHRLRHSFAVNFLRRGGGVFHLQRLLGHSSLEMTRRYCMLAEEDLAEAHRKASPVDRMNI